MAENKPQLETVPASWLHRHVLLAIFAAILLVILENWFFGRTLWQRVTTIEQELQTIEHELQPAQEHR